MNEDIVIMIELQEYSNAIRGAEKNIGKAREKISSSEKEIDDAKNSLQELDEAIKSLKNDIKQNELDLSELEVKAKRLDERRDRVHNEKELSAVVKELDKIKKDISILEEEALEHMEDLDTHEIERNKRASDLAEMEMRFDQEKPEIETEISAQEKIIDQNREFFDTNKDRLSSSYRAKFLKLINTKDGSAVAALDNEFCGNCNFKIPASVVISASREDKAEVCTNCGRFIYVKK